MTKWVLLYINCLYLLFMSKCWIAKHECCYWCGNENSCNYRYFL